MTPVNPRSQVGYRCENRLGTCDVEGARAEVSNTPQCMSCLSWHIYFLVVWKKFWKRVWKRFGIMMLPKSENHVAHELA